MKMTWSETQQVVGQAREFATSSSISSLDRLMELADRLLSAQFLEERDGSRLDTRPASHYQS